MNLDKSSDIAELVPTEFFVSQNYPNPFSESTTIKFCVAMKERVVLCVHDSDGNEIKRLVDEEKMPGTYEVIWNSAGYENGMYLFSFIAGDFIKVKKMTIKN